MGFLAAHLLVALPSAALAEQTPYAAYGIGQKSCEYWAQSQENDLEGKFWIEGFWSGINRQSDGPLRQTGNTATGGIMLSAVKRECALHPSETLETAVSAIWLSFAADSK